MRPNTTRTEEIEVCGECQEDIREHEKRRHYFVCPRCLETFCRNMKTQFAVIVRESTPRNYPAKQQRGIGVDLNTAPAHTVSYHDEYEWRADYCHGCAEHIRVVLTAAGLVNIPTKAEVAAIHD